ncbi:hypothetical protein PVAND_001986 [Polypedilum vanderplanki]|uniref:Aminopeptidase n=1 Tax=Polypedilum vanderplanki TaxID=319348 RepID=A0A9J6BQV4_POLVA|nr:hypothetical protein PVAND_001986 [Polypedilum vanderplanki]
MRQFYSSVIYLFIIFTSPLTNGQNTNYRLSDAVTPSAYDLFIQVDIGFYSFNGNVTIDIHVNKPTSTIELHNVNLTISNSSIFVKSVDDDEVKFESVYLIYNNESEIMTIVLEKPLTANTNYTITLAFSGRIEYDMKGLYMSSYYDKNIKYIATTFSAAAYARKIFPCFDEPHLKAKFRLRISCRDNFFALANTKVVNIQYEDDLFGTWAIREFEETIPMSIYLLAFTVSDFKNITSIDEGREFSVYASSKEYTNMQFALDVGKNALKALEEYTGFPYALDKMDFIAIDDFLYGAMENWGLISYKTSRIVNPEGKRNRKKIQSIITIITHELVHQWFGNLVTCEFWDYVWLNEGFASYIEYIIAEKILPDYRILEQFTIEDMHPVMLNDVKPKTHPMTRVVLTPEEITKIYDFVAYPKAASVIRMIEHIMTPGVFQRAIQLYLSERKFNSATDEHLYSAINRTQYIHTGLVNLPSIAEVFRSFAHNAGFPILNVNLTKDKNTTTMHISQELFSPFINETESSDFFIVFNYVTAQRASAEYWKPEKSEWFWIHNQSEIVIQLEAKPEWVIFNLQQTGYYRVNYDYDNWNAIINSLDSPAFHIIHPLNRAQLLDDSFNLAKAGYLDFSVILNMLKYLKREYELMPITAGFKAIEFLLTRFDNQPFYSDLLQMMREIIDEIYMRVNYPSHPEYPRAFSENYHEILKLKVNLFACRFGAPSCIKDARTQMFLYELTIKQPDVNSRPHLYCGGLHEDLAPSFWTQLKLRLVDITTSNEVYRDNQEEISEILFAMSSCDSDVGRVERLLTDIFNKSQSFPYESISGDDATAVITNLIRASSQHRELIMDFYYEHYFEIVNNTVPFSSILSAFAEAINTEEQLERLKELGIKFDIDVDSAIAEIERNIQWSTKKVPEIAHWHANNNANAIKFHISLLIFFSFLMFIMQ